MHGTSSTATATATSTTRSRRSKSPLAPQDPTNCPIAQLVQLAARAGAEFRLHGCEVLISNIGNLTPDLRSAFRARGDELWSHLGGIPVEVVSELLDTCNVRVAYPRTVEAARQVIAGIFADATSKMPAELQGQLSPWVGFDTETAADAGHELRPPIKLKKDGYPAKTQTALKETAGLDPHRSHIRILQFYAGGKHCLVFDTDLLPISLLDPLLTCCTLLTHNAGFDLRFLLNAGFDIERIHFEDSMQAGGLLLGAGNRSLDNVLHEMIGIALPKGLQRSEWHAPHLSAAQLTYAAADAVAAYKVWPILRQRLIATDRGQAYPLQRDLTRPVVRMIERGVTLDTTAHAALVQDWSQQHSETIAAFEQTAGQAVPTTPDEVRSYLAKVLPPATLAQWNVTQKTGELSTRAADLKRVAHLPGVRELLEVQQYVKLRNWCLVGGRAGAPATHTALSQRAGRAVTVYLRNLHPTRRLTLPLASGIARLVPPCATTGVERATAIGSPAVAVLLRRGLIAVVDVSSRDPETRQRPGRGGAVADRRIAGTPVTVADPSCIGGKEECSLAATTGLSCLRLFESR
jgi:ribonuclease D